MKIVRPKLLISHGLEGGWPVAIQVGEILEVFDRCSIITLEENDIDKHSEETKQGIKILEEYKDREYVLMTKDELKSVLNIIDDLRLLEGLSGGPALDKEQREFIYELRKLVE